MPYRRIGIMTHFSFLLTAGKFKIYCIILSTKIKRMLINTEDTYFMTNSFSELKPGIHDTSFASKSPFKFLEFKFFDRVYHTRKLNQKT